jgi:hypothetical protein
VTQVGPLKFDEIGRWSELKLEIVQKYGAAYTSALRNFPTLKKFIRLEINSIWLSEQSWFSKVVRDRLPAKFENNCFQTVSPMAQTPLAKGT